jgi:DNA-binding NarL/FixJ family response regulator
MSRGDWAGARDAFERAWQAEESADALDGLGRALWWLDDPEAALDLRARAFARLRHEQRDAEAAAVAIWLARQHQGLYRRSDVARGWLARARTLVTWPEEALHGWMALAESELEGVRSQGSLKAERAVELARRYADPDLEIAALARRGACAVSRGHVQRGVADLHEAMAAATSGEGRDVQFIGEALCTLLEVSGWLGDQSMVQPWATLLAQFRTSYTFGPLVPFDSGSATDLISAFCTGCCGAVYLVTGRLDSAEEQLARAVSQLLATGRRPRCLHPVAQLAELRVLQGRLHEAEVLLTGFDTDWECATARAALELALDEPAEAVTTLTAALDSLGNAPVLALQLQTGLVDAALAAGDLPLAEDAARRIAQTAGATGTALHRAQTTLARGKLAFAVSSADAPDLLRTAARELAESGQPMHACRARLALARSLVARDPGLAVTEARSALQAFDRMGATAERDRAAAFLRGLGVRGNTGPRGVGVLSRREHEVLRLVAEGLSNAEIAERLFISGKTAGHHVSNILMKLGLRSRTEAAAFALINLPRP